MKTQDEMRDLRRQMDAEWDRRLGAESLSLYITGKIFDERRRQDERWGGPEHDNQHGPRDWAAFITEHLGKALTAEDSHEYRKRMMEVAALAVAAIEVVERVDPSRKAVS